jgi:hypothetical protein
VQIDFENDVLDLTQFRGKQLNENILHVFAAWIEYLLSKMFKGRRVPVRVKGNKYGLDDPMTYKQKAKLQVAINRFEREAGINWPIKG